MWEDEINLKPERPGGWYKPMKGRASEQNQKA